MLYPNTKTQALPTIPYVVMLIYIVVFVFLYPARYHVQPSKMPPKAAIPSELREKQLCRAMDYARKHPSESKAKIADMYGVNAVTLRRRCKGVNVARHKAHREQQLLTSGEEDAIADWCGRMADMGFPVIVRMLLSITVAIL